MNCFDILGISSDSDKKAIKHAYAKLLKKYNPEDDPEGYQRLREAYDAALKYEKNHVTLDNEYQYDNHENDGCFEDQIDDSTNSNNNINDYLDDAVNDGYDNNKMYDDYHNTLSYEDIYNNSYYNEVEKQISAFTNKLNEVYSNLNLRIDKESWKKLLNDDILWNLDTAVRVKGIIITFICSHKFIPKGVMDEIDKILKIIGNEISCYNTYGKNIIDIYSDIYNNADTMSYLYLYSINPADQDQYLALRLDMLRLLQSSHSFALSEITDCFNQAENLYDKDPELYMIMACYYIEIGYNDNALLLYKKALTIDPYYSEANKKAGKILFDRRNFEEAASFLERYFGSSKDDTESLYMLAHCYYYIKSYQKSLNCFNMLKSKCGKNRYINSYIKNADRKMNSRLSSTIKFNITNYKINNPVKDASTKATVKKYNSKKVMVTIMIIIFSLSTLSTIIRHSNNTRTSTKSTINTKDAIKYTNNSMQSLYTTIDSLKGFKEAALNTRVSISLSDVEVMDCYKLVAYTNENIRVTRFMKKQDMLDKNYWIHAHGRIYSGKIDGKRIFFECSKDLDMEFKKGTKYIIKGYDCTLTEDMYKSLSSFVESPDDYLSTRYIATTPYILNAADINNTLNNDKKNTDTK